MVEVFYNQDNVSGLVVFDSTIVTFAHYERGVGWFVLGLINPALDMAAWASAQTTPLIFLMLLIRKEVFHAAVYLGDKGTVVGSLCGDRRNGTKSRTTAG